MRTTRKPKRGFLDYKNTYDTSAGYGNSAQWRNAFSERMGIDEAKDILRGQKRTPLQILGLVGIAYTIEQIKQAFRKRAMELHPDRALQNGMTIEQATEAFKELNAAYTILRKD